MGLIPILGEILATFITPTTMIAMTSTLLKLHIAWLLNLPMYVDAKLPPVRM